MSGKKAVTFLKKSNQKTFAPLGHGTFHGLSLKGSKVFLLLFLQKKKSFLTIESLAAAFALFLLLAAAAPHVLAPQDPLATDPLHIFAAPSAAHLLGTDENGRDVWSRLIHAARLSLLLAIAGAFITTVVGAALGLAAGLGPKPVDQLIVRLSDILQSLPEVPVLLVVIAIWGSSVPVLIGLLGYIGVSRVIRQTRAQVLVLRRAGFVEAALTLGLPRWRVVVRHVLPNALRPVFTVLPIDVGWKIGAIAILGFLGLGAPPPAPDWGGMLALDRDYVLNAWWVAAASAAMITFTVLAVNTLGRALDKRFGGAG